MIQKFLYGLISAPHLEKTLALKKPLVLEKNARGHPSRPSRAQTTVCTHTSFPNSWPHSLQSRPKPAKYFLYWISAREKQDQTTKLRELSRLITRATLPT